VAKFVLLSIVWATIIVPLVAARERSAKRAIKKTLLVMVAFAAFYLFALRFIVSRL
jgi:hypothetical protein